MYAACPIYANMSDGQPKPSQDMRIELALKAPRLA